MGLRTSLPGALATLPALLIAAAPPGVEGFIADHPGTLVARGHGRVTRLYGPAFGHGPSAIESARRFVARHADVLGAAAADLAPGGPSAGGRHVTPVVYDAARDTFRFTAVSWRQERQGIPVYEAFLTLLVRNEPGFPLVLAASSLRDLSGFEMPGAGAGAARADTAPVAIARAAALAHGAGFAGPAQILASRPVIFAGIDLPAPARLAEEHTIGIDVDRYGVIVDAFSGAVLHEERRIYSGTISGQVVGLASEDPGAAMCGAEIPMPLTSLQVFVGDQVAFTDADGNFAVNVPGTEPVAVSAGLSGPWFVVEDRLGQPESASVTATPADPVELVLNAANDDDGALAQVNAWVAAHRIRDLVLAANPSFPGLDQPLPVVVNWAPGQGLCPGNAWYESGSMASINFCLPDGADPNTAFTSVVCHEYGHHLVALGGAAQGPYGEGMGDTMSVLLLDIPDVGIGWDGICEAGLRTADNTTQNPCNGGSHFCGQVLSGAIWHTRNELVITEPDSYLEIIRSLTVNSILLESAGGVTPAICIDFLTLDDDDADITNGTPHVEEIITGFAAHTLVPTDVSFGFPSGLPFWVHANGSTAVPVTLSALLPLVIKPLSATLHVDWGGGYVAVPMQEFAPGSYQAIFPEVPCGSSVSYYFSVDTVGPTRTMPVGAPALAYSTIAVTDVTTLFHDDFEFDLGWTVTGGATDGPWERGVPLPGCAPGSDGDGSGQTWITGNGDPDCADGVDGGVTTLVSPPIEFRGGEGAFVSYWRWFSGATDDHFRSFVTADGGVTWAPLEALSYDAVPGWNRAVISLEGFMPPDERLRFAFTATDAGIPTPVEAAVDGLAILQVCRSSCPWDCGDRDGVTGILDLLDALAQWGTRGPCDLDGGGVGESDLQAVIAAFGPCR